MYTRNLKNEVYSELLTVNGSGRQILPDACFLLLINRLKNSKVVNELTKLRHLKQVLAHTNKV